MNNINGDVFEVAGVYLWVEQDTSIHIKATSDCGDPIELTADEANELGVILMNLSKSIID